MTQPPGPPAPNPNSSFQEKAVDLFLRKEVFVPLEVSQDIQEVGYAFREELLSEDLLHDPENLGIWRFLRKAKREPNFRSLAILAWGDTERPPFSNTLPTSMEKTGTGF